MEIKSKEITLVDIETLVPWDKNTNTHSEDQKKRLCKLIKHTGFRDPLIVSKRSGFMVAGHLRLECAKELGMDKVPVSFQDFKDEAEEYAFMNAHNAIAAWAEIDMAKVNIDLPNYGPELDVEMLGMRDVVLDPSELQNYGDKNKEIDTDNFGNDLRHICPKCSFEFND